MKIKAQIITSDKMNYPDAPNYSKEFEVKTVEDIVSHAESELNSFNGIYPDSMMIFAWNDDNDSSFEDEIFDYETKTKGEKLIDALDDIVEKIRCIDINSMLK